MPNRIGAPAVPSHRSVLSPHSLPDSTRCLEKDGTFPMGPERSPAQGHKLFPAPAYSHWATLLEYCSKSSTLIISPQPSKVGTGVNPTSQRPQGLSHKPSAAPSTAGAPSHLHTLLLPLLLPLGDSLHPASLPCQAGRPSCQLSCGWCSCRQRCSPGQ